jgi:hypothetical protein
MKRHLPRGRWTFPAHPKERDGMTQLPRRVALTPISRQRRVKSIHWRPGGGRAFLKLSRTKAAKLLRQPAAKFLCLPEGRQSFPDPSLERVAKLLRQAVVHLLEISRHRKRSQSGKHSSTKSLIFALKVQVLFWPLNCCPRLSAPFFRSLPTRPHSQRRKFARCQSGAALHYSHRTRFARRN